jgi:transcriptional regulator with XRE-family HTH domain
MKKQIRKQIREADRVVGVNLRGLRNDAGLSQTDLAAALGITFQQIQKYENGANRLSGSSIIRLCEVLKTSSDKLLGIKMNGAANAASSIDLLDNPNVRKALQALHELPRKRQIVIANAMMVLVQAFK